MKKIEMLKQTLLSDEMVSRSDLSGCALSIAGVYQDSVTQEWGTELCRRVTRVAGEERVQNKWYDANSLSDTAILMDAVHAAVAADVIVVSIYANNDLPLDLYVWIEAWLPRRISRVGALAAVIGTAEALDAQLHTFEYLHAVARMGQLDFIPQERKRPDASTRSSTKGIAHPASTTAQSLPELYGQRFDAYTFGLY
jgi:hypothetical protein